MLYHSLFAVAFALDSVHATELNGVPIERGIYDVGEPHWLTFRTHNPIALIAYVIPWCKHCKEFGPIYDELALKIERTMPQVAVARVRTDKWKKIAEWENIKNVPTVAFYNGKTKTLYEGDRTFEDLYEWTLTQMREQLGDKAQILDDPLDFSMFNTLSLVAVGILFALYLCNTLRKGLVAKRSKSHKDMRRMKTIRMK